MYYTYICSTCIGAYPRLKLTPNWARSIARYRSAQLLAAPPTTTPERGRHDLDRHRLASTTSPAKMTTVVVQQPGATTVVTQPKAEAQDFIQLPSADQLFMCCACCCSKTSIYHKVPDCCGFTVLSECLCCRDASKCNIQCDHLSICTSSPECFCCDFKKDMSKDGCFACRSYDICCLCCLSQTDNACKIPTTCCKSSSQCLCCDDRCALPCDDQVPFQIGCLGIYCVGKPAPKQNVVAVVNAPVQQPVMMMQQPVQQPVMVVQQPAPSADMER